jgi:molecular chaperone Hsp33
MKNTDSMQTFIFENKPACGALVHLDKALETILDKHDYPKLIEKTLSEAIISALLLFSISKQDSRLTLQFEGNDGADISFLSVSCTPDWKIRALAQYNKDCKQLNKTGTESLEVIEKSLKNGKLIITFEPEKKSSSSQRYQSIVPILHGSISQAMEEYFTQSVQNKTRVFIQSDITKTKKHISAFMLQFLPSTSSIKTDKIEDLAKFDELCIFAESLRDKELLETDNKKLLKNLFNEEDIRLFDSKEISFFCPCSKDKMEQAITNLGKEEAFKVLHESDNAQINVKCEFCLSEYDFDQSALEKLFKVN